MQKVKEFLIYVIIIVSLILGVKHKPLKKYTQPKELKDTMIILKTNTNNVFGYNSENVIFYL